MYQTGVRNSSCNQMKWLVQIGWSSGKLRGSVIFCKEVNQRLAMNSKQAKMVQYKLKLSTLLTFWFICKFAFRRNLILSLKSFSGLIQSACGHGKNFLLINKRLPKINADMPPPGSVFSAIKSYFIYTQIKNSGSLFVFLFRWLLF